MQPNMQKVSLEFKNIGYVKHIDLELKQGLNVIRAPNASGKSSLIRGLTSMFSNRISPSHILSLNQVRGTIRVQYFGKTYKKYFKRTPSGEVVTRGRMLPFFDHRAFDACVALAETGVVHKITGGGTAFRNYLEKLSYGKYYSTIIEAAEELVNEMSRELVGPHFEKFEALPLLLTELTHLHTNRDQLKEKIKDLENVHKADVQSLLEKLKEKEFALSREEMNLSELRRNLKREEEKKQQLLGFLELAEDSTEVAAQIKDGMDDSKEKQKQIIEEIAKQEENIENLKGEVDMLKGHVEQKKADGVKGLEDFERELERVNKAVVLKEEEIQQAERFPLDDLKYPERLVIEVRAEMMKKIEWLNGVIAYFQEKYMRRMTTARIRFNLNITKAFEQLDLKEFDNIFLNQDFTLNVVRENSILQPVETLSASEKLTVSLILMLAAKETFLPDFPFFIIDELTLSYDPQRFKQIVSYIGERVQYLIVTSLTSSEAGKPEIIYNLDAIEKNMQFVK